jgi:hypothetical protein
MVGMSDITFESLNKSHLSLLLNWLDTPHVKLWWDQDIKWTTELIQEKYGHYINEYKILTLKGSVIKNQFMLLSFFLSKVLLAIFNIIINVISPLSKDMIHQSYQHPAEDLIGISVT